MPGLEISIITAKFKTKAEEPQISRFFSKLLVGNARRAEFTYGHFVAVTFDTVVSIAAYAQLPQWLPTVDIKLSFSAPGPIGAYSGVDEPGFERDRVPAYPVKVENGPRSS
jgi:hypothetical protein